MAPTSKTSLKFPALCMCVKPQNVTRSPNVTFQVNTSKKWTFVLEQHLGANAFQELFFSGHLLVLRFPHFQSYNLNKKCMEKKTLMSENYAFVHNVLQ